MNAENGDCKLYLLLDNATEAESVAGMFRAMYPAAELEISDSPERFFKNISGMGSDRRKSFVVTSTDYPESTLRKIADAANYWFTPVVLIKDEHSPVSVSPFNPIVLLNRRFAMGEFREAAAAALEMSAQYLKFSVQVDRFELLNQREVNILQLASVGFPNKSIARRLDISIKTVEKNRRNAYLKLNITSAAEMASLVTFQKFCRTRPATRPLPTNLPLPLNNSGTGFPPVENSSSGVF